MNLGFFSELSIYGNVFDILIFFYCLCLWVNLDVRRVKSKDIQRHGFSSIPFASFLPFFFYGTLNGTFPEAPGVSPFFFFLFSPIWWTVFAPLWPRLEFWHRRRLWTGCCPCYPPPPRERKCFTGMARGGGGKPSRPVRFIRGFVWCGPFGDRGPAPTDVSSRWQGRCGDAPLPVL